MPNCDPRYDILFEPVKIGPVTAKNRFYQVPHCNGMGYLRPNTLAAMRGMKAEGGWAVVCTEEVEIHPSSDNGSAAEGRLWDDGDIPALAKMTEAVHEHGALAGIELVHGGFSNANNYSRIPPIAPSGTCVNSYDPIQARTMNMQDIRNFRKWHRQAVIRAIQADFDLVYVYAGHNLTLLMHFLSKRYNHRTDEYGGSLENRVRLFREVLEETREVAGDRCAIAIRFAVDELLGPKGITSENEGKEVLEILSELPDLWDVNISDWENDSGTSRFDKEGYQEPYIGFVKSITSKPVVGVGRYTSPDKMASLIQDGVMDMIGAARPSIADPFLPKKIEEGRLDEIRECIGCNICVAGDWLAVPMRCTQNPTMGEEWRRGWHPEKTVQTNNKEGVMVVGGGPSGLECALTLGKMGFRVMLAEKSDQLGGRINLESCLPGLEELRRVRDHRLLMLEKLKNVSLYPGSFLTSEDIFDFSLSDQFGFSHVILATGSSWRRDGMGRQHREPIPGLDLMTVLSADDLLNGVKVKGKVIIFDDDHYYMAGALAEKLRKAGFEVMIVTPAPDISNWTHNTMEQGRIQAKLLELGVELAPQKNLVSIHQDEIELACVFTEQKIRYKCDTLVLVTERLPNDQLYHELNSNPDKLNQSKIKSLQCIGDSLAPGIIANAIYSGHLAAREIGVEKDDQAPFLRERIVV